MAVVFALHNPLAAKYACNTSMVNRRTLNSCFDHFRLPFVGCQQRALILRHAHLRHSIRRAGSLVLLKAAVALEVNT